MANYYYAYSGHKHGLDRVRRGAALIKALRGAGIDMQLLVSDFRAGLAARELGVSDAITIETLMDVDAVAQRGDSIILDTPEDISMRAAQYCDLFERVFCVTYDCDDGPSCSEIVMKPTCIEGEACIKTPIIDPEYFTILPKEKRTLLFFGDADYDKEILAHRDIFEGRGIELLLGHYFFVDYEDALEEIFDSLHESDVYTDMIRSSSRVLTASAQCAFEARAAEAETHYLKREGDSPCLIRELEAADIKIIDDYVHIGLDKVMMSREKSARKVANRMDTIVAELHNSYNL